jgi:hypothetical protein
MTEPMESVDNKTEKIEKILSVLIVLKDPGACITTGSDVVERTGIFYSERTCHEESIAEDNLYFKT